MECRKGSFRSFQVGPKPCFRAANSPGECSGETPQLAPTPRSGSPSPAPQLLHTCHTSGMGFACGGGGAGSGAETGWRIWGVGMGLQGQTGKGRWQLG